MKNDLSQSKMIRHESLRDNIEDIEISLNISQPSVVIEQINYFLYFK